MADDAPKKKNDIDFDELDKAVNSLMGKVGGETLEDSDKTKTLDINTTLDKGEKPVYDDLSKAAKGIGSESLVIDSEVELVEDLGKLPEKMDLPVNDEKADETASKTEVVTVTTSTPKPEPEPEEAPVEAAEPKPEEPAKVNETPAEKPVVAPKPAVKRPSSGRFMDMVHPKADMTTPPLPSLVVPERKGVVTAAAPPAPPVVQKPQVTEPAEPDPVLATPFIPDAKVEKRPLGAAISTGPSIPAASLGIEVDKPAEPKPTDEDKASEESVVETEPINSEHEKKHDDGSGDEQRALNASDFEKQSSTDEELTKIESMEAAEPTPVKVETPQSIERVESGDTEMLKNIKKADKLDGDVKLPEGAIYDTKDYHKAISHPPKQKSGWGKVVVIVLIVVLAVAIGVGAYLVLGFQA